MFNIRALATINILVQGLLLIGVLISVFLARKGQLDKHCVVMRVAVGLQLFTIFSLMLPAMLGYLKHPGQEAFQIEMLVHHGLGALVVLLWIYINLAVSRRVKVAGQLTTYMWSAFTIWSAAFLLGLYLYFQLFVLQ